MARVIRLRFIKADGGYSEHGFDFLISPAALAHVREIDRHRWINRNTGGSVCTFNIETEDGNRYNGSPVFIESIEERDNYRGMKKIVKMTERRYEDEERYCVPFGTNENEFDLSPCEDVTPITNKTTNPKTKKEDKCMSNSNAGSMFSRLGLTFGKVDDVFFSIYGPAFVDETREGSVVAYDANKGEYVDVTDFSTDDANLCYAIPTPTSQIKAGDFIRNGDEWARVSSVKAKGVLVLEEIKTRKIVEVLPTKNLWGFSFTTKLVSLMDGMTGGTSPDNPMGNLPMMMMLMNEDGGEASGNLPLMMMMMNGGSGEMMKNPLMLAAMMGGKGGKDMMPMLMMSQMLQQQQTAPAIQPNPLA